MIAMPELAGPILFVLRCEAKWSEGTDVGTPARGKVGCEHAYVMNHRSAQRLWTFTRAKRPEGPQSAGRRVEYAVRTSLFIVT